MAFAKGLNMKSNVTKSLVAMVGLSCLAGGCQSGGIFYEPSAAITQFSTDDLSTDHLFPDDRVADDHIILAAEFAQQPAKAAASQPARPASQPAKKKSYTAPGSPMQKLTFLAVVGASMAAADVVSEGREAAENSLGRANLQSSLAPAGQGIAGSTTLLSVGKRGLLTGPSLGGGLSRNIFSPGRNPLTGPTGRCQDLVRVGFFSNATACRNYFGH